MRIGIVGMPYVGKTTVFNALTKSSAETGGYASQKDANVSVIKVSEDRLEPLGEIFNPKKLVHANIEYIDVVGMRKGAVKDGSMDARLLADLRTVDALAHVVRVFEDDRVPHVDGSVEPERDIENLNTELALADLQIIENRLERLDRELRASKEANLLREQELLQKFRSLLESGVPLRETEISDDDEKIIRGYQFLTQKPLLLILNIGEDQIEDTESLLAQFSEYEKKQNTSVLAVCAKIEMEIAQLEDDEEASLFLEEMGLSESAMTRVIHTSYDLLGLITFFTGGDNEVRAWTAKRETMALAAAGMIHSDMERGFIRAEIIQAKELIKCGSLAKAKESGLLRLEGKEYILQEGDFMTVRFNV